MAERTGVCVIGGGPAGTTIAAGLARLGHVVTLLEAEQFPRRHEGESLPPSIVPLLDQLGVRAEVERAGFFRPTAAIVHWAGQRRPQTDWGGSPGFQVDRGRFDRILLSAAARAGVHVLERATARPPVRRGPRDWTVEALTPAGPLAIDAEFIVDASGRRGILGGRKRRLTAPTVAVYGYWSGVGPAGGETRVEAGEDRWYWAAPIPDGTWNATVFTSSERIKGRPGDLAAAYRQLLADSVLLSEIGCGRLETTVRVCASSPQADDSPVGVDWIKVGEAAFAVDPISSQGVQTAIAQALGGTCVAHTLLAGAGTEAAVTYYANRLREDADRHLRQAGVLYHEQWRHRPTAFWAARSRPAADEPRFPDRPLDGGQLLVRAPAVRFVSAPVIRGDFVRTERAIVHPNLDRPIAFLGGVPVAPLLDRMSHPTPVWRLVTDNSCSDGTNRSLAILRWLWNRGLVEDAPPG
ncbi:flavin-dependent monooxygenase QhpG [Limnoglobus roseus]|uniref:NAD(P)/FAD-dependent oxidoreductase n=1 Tax=Limnoglobus roseus TaxID=2598579 RepID=A0A5C1A3J2_9BACT|nr:NAD(P)/FAD-dependent oxidoreductase [Limnoglobus roseus]QEL13649.1 NAD(P)/FAD-dependent oxidoreductase [Limnoglobus roseus]